MTTSQESAYDFVCRHAACLRDGIDADTWKLRVALTRRNAVWDRQLTMKHRQVREVPFVCCLPQNDYA